MTNRLSPEMEAALMDTLGPLMNDLVSAGEDIATGYECGSGTHQGEQWAKKAKANLLAAIRADRDAAVRAERECCSQEVVRMCDQVLSAPISGEVGMALKTLVGLLMANLQTAIRARVVDDA